jgi:hypothetical protein
VATTLPGSTPNMLETSLTGGLEPLLKIRTYEFVRTAPDHPFPLTRHNSLIYHSFGVRIRSAKSRPPYRVPEVARECAFRTAT